MISRRSLLGTGAAVAVGATAVVAARATHTLDDAARAVGLDPKPEPDPREQRLVRRTARDLAALLAVVESTRAAHPGLALDPVAAVVREQLAAVGGTAAATDVAPAPGTRRAAARALEAACRDAATARAADAASASSPALVRVLAAMSGGLAQCARVVGTAA